MGGEDGKEEMYSHTEARAFEATRMAISLVKACLHRGFDQNGSKDVLSEGTS
jgi:hypothetical protein